MQNPLISILIPFKNVEDYFEDCLRSVINQNYTNWEVIAVDDHSTDKSATILEQFALKNPRIKCYKNSGRGIIPALQLAYSKCQGAFITRMDSDDKMMPERLSVMVNSLLHHGTGHVAVGQVKYFSHRGISNGYARYEKWLNKLTATGDNYSEIYKECVIPSPCWMVHRDDFEKADAFNPSRYPEDYDLAFRFYKEKLKCIPCNQVLHQWRDYDTRTSRTSEHYAQNYFLDIKLHYFLELDCDTKKTLVIWGAGTKGKTIAKNLIERKIDFMWICDNPKKIGREIYGTVLEHYTKLGTIKNPQSIITVANDEAQKQIREIIQGLGHKQMQDYFFFC